MIKAFAALAVLVGLAACTGAGNGGLDTSGRGEPARLVYAAPGTRIILSNSVNGTPSQTTITVRPSTGPGAAYENADGKMGKAYPGCWDCGTDMQIDEAAYAQLWPLETGKQISFIRTSPDGQQTRIFIRVAGVEMIKTPAGSFDTYLLDGRMENITGPRYSAQVKAWWAPDPGWVVRAEGGDSQGSVLRSEAVEIIAP